MSARTCTRCASPTRPAPLPGRAPAAFLCALGLGAALLASACRKERKPPAPPAPAATPAPAPASGQQALLARADAAAMTCPPEAGPDTTFAKLIAGSDRSLRTACTVLYEGFYWGAAALTWPNSGAKSDTKSGAKSGPSRPSVHFLTGGPLGPTLVFDLEPAPTQEIAALLKSSAKVRVQIRRSRADRSLVRLGVVGETGSAARPQSREIGALIQLVAHSPPRVLWWGRGDETSTGASGCLDEQTVDFELLFRTRLERYTTTQSRPVVPGEKAPACPAPSSTQENLPFHPTPLKVGRPL